MSYNGKFQDVKDSLPKLYVNAEEFLPILKKLKSINLGFRPLAVGEISDELIVPIMVSDNVLKFNITHSIIIDNKNTTFDPRQYIHIGYKRSDEFLDKYGNHLHKSKSFKMNLEYVKCRQSWVNWLLFKVAALFKVALFMILILGIGINAQAQAVAIGKGQAAPYDGILLSEAMAKQNEKTLLELDFVKSSNSLYKVNYDLAQSESDKWRNIAIEANTELAKREQSAIWKLGISFIIGSALTMGLAFAVNKAVNK